MLTWFINTKKMARPRSTSTPSSLGNLRGGIALVGCILYYRLVGNLVAPSTVSPRPPRAGECYACAGWGDWLSCDRWRLLRLGNNPEVRLDRLPAAGILLFGFLIGDRRNNDHIIALLPVHRGGHLVRGRQLHRIED